MIGSYFRRGGVPAKGHANQIPPAQEFTLKETGSRDTVSKKDQILIVAECNPFLQEILELLEHAFRNKLERSKYLFFTLFNSFLVKKVEYIHVVTLPS